MDCYLFTVLLPHKFNPTLICLNHDEDFQKAPEEISVRQQQKKVQQQEELSFSKSVFPGGTVGKNLPANAGDTGDVDLIPGWGRTPGG